MTSEHATRRLSQATACFWRRVLVAQLIIIQYSMLMAAAQTPVPNDDIERRRVLHLNEPITSSTAGCTVQWKCVDERLTGKCIEYHNDQWFEVTPLVTGRYFVNISAQQCRDTRGVQLVVLTGEPCQPKTYQILTCVSLGSQDDVFVTLDELRAGQRYLLNVDGYLHDFCAFQLAVSDKALGVPALAPPTIASVAPTISPLVNLQWTLPDSLVGANQFRVLRREMAEFRADERNKQPVQRTTYGAAGVAYRFQETLAKPGRYLYQILTEGTDNQPPVLLQQRWVAYSKLMPMQRDTSLRYLRVPLGQYKTGAKLSVVATDAASGRVVGNRQIIKQKKIEQMSLLPVVLLQQQGVREVRVRITQTYGPGQSPTSDELTLLVPVPSSSQ
ncbi:hypothetical protein HMJ29_09960 [Hymenobacter taeanensis]|uniref:Uncharacterized protein n=1 Tax=Hymenobacter taeanensis TaxID=2735321 RepID=A0A6M6BF77_9BACT|nr:MULTISPECIES: hypothetical protein [Hymenobacter]QJX47241.1 hypothetical protein HMJ29_09960 [Hymenobacter taeanensis]UOQ79422.1 hypothetical protein MUN83_11170 [Hymenobacter sp. 5414T-23]